MNELLKGKNENFESFVRDRKFHIKLRKQIGVYVKAKEALAIKFQVIKRDKDFLEMLADESISN